MAHCCFETQISPTFSKIGGSIIDREVFTQPRHQVVAGIAATNGSSDSDQASGRSRSKRTADHHECQSVFNSMRMRTKHEKSPEQMFGAPWWWRLRNPNNRNVARVVNDCTVNRVVGAGVVEHGAVPIFEQLLLQLLPIPLSRIQIIERSCDRCPAAVSILQM